MKKYEPLKQAICDEFNEKRYIPDYSFLRTHVAVCDCNNELILAINHHSHKSFNSSSLIDLYKVTKKDDNQIYFQKIGYVQYILRRDIIRLSQIEIYQEENNKGYGSTALKIFEFFSTRHYSGKIKIVGSFAPLFNEKSEQVKKFYKSNGYTIKKPLFEKREIIKKEMYARDIKKTEYDYLYVLDNNNIKNECLEK